MSNAVKDATEKLQAVENEIAKRVVGQRDMVRKLLVGLLTNGHILLEGVPGLAKTLTVSSLAESLKLDFSRVQFTPDLLPADVVGTEIYNPREATFEKRQGPVFANIVLADEINRAPAKVQSALLEAMQEKQVTIGGESFKLPRPFLVLATQNPVEQEGTYPLPEAQGDRFMLKIFVGYPTDKEELEIMRRVAKTDSGEKLKPKLTPKELLEFRKLVDSIRIEERLEEYIVRLVSATRDPKAHGLKDFEHLIEFGASPRASIAMHLAARAWALIHGRDYATPDDVKAVAVDALNHRIMLTYEAEAENLDGRAVVGRLLDHVEL